MSNPIFAIGDELLAAELNGIATVFTIQKFTSGGTWVKPDGCTRVLVDVVGGGGSGGGNPTTGVGQFACSGGGGGGGWARKLLLASALASSETVDVGAGGAAASVGAAGNAGGVSNFATGKAYVVTANGGAGGALGVAGTATGASGGAGGTSSGGDINVEGEGGGYGAVEASRPFFFACGGGNQFGPTVWPPNNVLTNGRAGKLYGGGSSGAISGSSEGTRGSTAGAAGIVIVYNFF